MYQQGTIQSSYMYVHINVPATYQPVISRVPARLGWVRRDSCQGCRAPARTARSAAGGPRSPQFWGVWAIKSGVWGPSPQCTGVWGQPPEKNLGSDYCVCQLSLTGVHTFCESTSFLVMCFMKLVCWLAPAATTSCCTIFSSFSSVACSKC